MRTWLMVAFVSALLSATAGSAKALTTLRGAGNDDENIYVAMVDVTGDGTHNKVPVVCFDSTNNTHDTYYIIGTTSGLDDDYQIHGDSTDGGTGSDSLQIGWTSSGYCGSITDTGGSANLAYNSWYLDLYGDGGNDRYLSDGGGTNDTWINGGAGDDFLAEYSSAGRAHGDAGDDTVWGLDGSGDVLYGDTGADCLWDSNNSFSVFNCGNDAGDTRDSTNSGTTGCPNTGTCRFI